MSKEDVASKKREKAAAIKNKKDKKDKKAEEDALEYIRVLEKEEKLQNKSKVLGIFNEVVRKSRKDKFEKAEDLLEKKQSLKDFKQSTIQSIEQNMKDKVEKRYKRKLKARDLLN